MNKQINSTEIARLAGVSRSTVSRVVNGYANVPEATKRKVLEVIEQYNYYPNLSAQVLAGKRTRTLGLFIVDAGSVSSDSISNLILSSIVESASGSGYYVLTHIVSDMRSEEHIRAIKECFCQRRIDAGIFIGAKSEEPLIEELLQKGYIIGIVDQYVPDRQELNRIVYNFDNEAGVELAVGYLASLNHERIGAIHGDMERYSGPSKRAGFVKAMLRRTLPVRDEWMLDGDFNEESGYRAMRRLLDSGHELPTAMFAANDSVAFGAIRALRERGLRVPEDMSVIGFDDHLLSARHQPPLSTVKVDFAAMMKRLTGDLIRCVEKPSTVEAGIAVVEGVTLIARESCRMHEKR